jgi:hypothetical protein
VNDLHPVAATIADVLLNKLGSYVPEADLEAATGEDGYTCRWYIFHLREAGYQIEAAAHVDREAFKNGARGWTLVDIGSAVATAPVAKVAPQPAPVAARKGLKVWHPTHGAGQIVFVRVGFPKVAVTFASGLKASCETGELLAQVGKVYALIE